MNCCICLEDNILEEDIHYMECLHYVCSDCFILLIDDSCPYCRQKIYLSTRQIYTTDDEEENTMEYENDFIVPVIRRDRNEIKRRRIRKRRQELINIIQEENHLPIVPNIKHRFNRKIDNILI